MSACLSGGGGGAAAAAYSFELEKVKSPPSSSTTTTRATSPSSTLSESSNSPLAISTRKPRTQRKRPNQTYNEAAALLSTAYPNIFSSNNNNNMKKKTHSNSNFYGFVSDNDEASELLLPFESIEEPDFLFQNPIQSKSDLYFEHKEVNSSSSGGGGGGRGEIVESQNQFDFSDEFVDAESILEEEIEERGIDSIIGTLESESIEKIETRVHKLEQIVMMNQWNGNYKGFRFAGKYPLGLGLRSALRENDDDASWWRRFHTVDFDQISPRIKSTIAAVEDEKVERKKVIGEKSSKKKQKKKKKVAAETTTATTALVAVESKINDTEERSASPMLKLDYDGVLKAWSDKASPFSDDILGSEATGADVNARLAQIDLFGDNGIREASVLRYKEKRRTRLFSKKIRYQVRKLNADQRPRMKGRFVRRPNANTTSGHR
ncbi:unnamed protein product [Cochlearia groenlandica]